MTSEYIQCHGELVGLKEDNKGVVKNGDLRGVVSEGGAIPGQHGWNDEEDRLNPC